MSGISHETPHGMALAKAKICTPAVAELLGLSFADRDIELIGVLRDSPSVPGEEDFPTAEQILSAIDIDPRWAPFTLEKVKRFVHKRRLNGDFTQDQAHFAQRADVQALVPHARRLPVGTTVFIGDSLMDNRHFAANASFAVLLGGFLESLGRGPYVNAGIGGETAAQGLARFEKDVMAHKPARIVFSFGNNDVANGASLEKVQQDFQAMIDPAKGIGAQVVVGTTLHVIAEKLWWNEWPLKNSDDASRDRLQAAMEAMAKKNGLACMRVIDKLGPAHYCVDGIHITQEAQEICALEALRCLCGGGS